MKRARDTRTDDPWAPIRDKIASHRIELTNENVTAIREGTYRLPRTAVPTNEELADALEAGAGAAVPYEMLMLVAARLRVAPTPGVRGRRPVGDNIPDDARQACAIFAVCWNAHGRQRGERSAAIAATATHCGLTESTVATLVKNHWAKFCRLCPELAMPPR